MRSSLVMIVGPSNSRVRCSTTGLFVLGLIFNTPGDAVAQVRKARPTHLPLLAACHFSEDADAFLPLPIFNGSGRRQQTASAAISAQTKEDAGAEEDEEEDEDEEDEEEDEEEPDPPVRNFMTAQAGPGLQRGPCFRISGTATYSVTLKDGTTVNRAGDRLLKEARATVGLQMIEELPVGRFRAVLELDSLSSAGTVSPSLKSAWMSLGPVSSGLKGSNFDFWAGDEFGFKATAPSATTFVSSLGLRTSEKSTLILSAEDPTSRRLASAGYAGDKLPDVVARWRYENDTTTLHFGGAVRQVRFASPDVSTRYGYALVFGIQQQIASFGTGDYVTAQLAYADKAPGYLGIAQPGGLLNFTLPRDAPVVLLETMRGWTAALAYSHGWSDTWRSNAFATYLDLRLTEKPARGKAQVGRAAVNLVWTPVAGLDLTWELGVGQIFRVDTSFGLVNVPTRPSYSGQFSISRKF